MTEMTEYVAAGYPAYGSVDDVDGVRAILRKLVLLKGHELEIHMDHGMYAMSDRFMSLKNWLYRAGMALGGRVTRKDLRANLVAILETGRPLTEFDWVYD